MGNINFKSIIFCLAVGVGVGYLATRFLGKSLGFSPYLITIIAAFAPFFTGSMTFKKDD